MGQILHGSACKAGNRHQTDGSQLLERKAGITWLIFVCERPQC